MNETDDAPERAPQRGHPEVSVSPRVAFLLSLVLFYAIIVLLYRRIRGS